MSSAEHHMNSAAPCSKQDLQSIRLGVKVATSGTDICGQKPALPTSAPAHRAALYARTCFLAPHASPDDALEASVRRHVFSMAFSAISSAFMPSSNSSPTSSLSLSASLASVTSAGGVGVSFAVAAGFA
eukprot:CAMPEP_0117566306 /NCGR_PEP_ID=MMETSP0784-20121206/57025_1 /TAXON_ID=39447 /ORGANISM="" /LENGTH=128 /DNA_ID=CAMNT_0005364145 /DNA_START=447 /DNA_END=834 /DNA_ORIENTATION=-